jgi:hypothetical protein
MRALKYKAMRKVYFQWDEPPEVTAHRWKERSKVLKRFVLLFFKWSLLFGLPSSIYIAFLQPSALPVALFAVSYPAVFMPALLWLRFWLPSRNRNIRCVIDEQGVGIRIGKYSFYGLHCYWNKITAYEFTDHAVLKDIRCLNVKLLHERRSSQLYFHSQQVNEQELNSFMQEKTKA